jgi:hypothetical protein
MGPTARSRSIGTTGRAWGVGGRLDEKVLRNWVVAPQTMNPTVRKRAYDKLPKDDLDALVAYLRSLRS